MHVSVGVIRSLVIYSTKNPNYTATYNISKGRIFTWGHAPLGMLLAVQRKHKGAVALAWRFAVLQLAASSSFSLDACNGRPLYVGKVHTSHGD